MNIWEAIQKMKEGKKIGHPTLFHGGYIFLDNNTIKYNHDRYSCITSVYNQLDRCMSEESIDFCEYVEPHKEIKVIHVGDLFQLYSGNRAIVFNCYVDGVVKYGLLGACDEFRGYSGSASVGSYDKIVNTLNQNEAVFIRNISKELGQLIEQEVNKAKK